ncbi:MAG: SDR family NAD(P)-dependent oxidoreductase, partial [Aeromicrobium sp.]
MNGAAPVVLVTGASSGIGRAVALGAARTGAHLVLVARDGQALTDVAEECEGLGAAGTCVEPV